MKTKYVITAAACIFVLIAGICYVCARGKTQAEEASLELIEEEQVVNPADELSVTESHTESSINNKSSVLEGAFVPEKESPLEVEKASAYAHICGAVKKPGVYQITENTRVVDLIELAGGLHDTAAGDYVNQAQQVSDGQRVYIPTKDEVELLPVGGVIAGVTEQEPDAEQKGKLININTATVQELMELPGIGEAKAASILDYRATEGGFQTIEDLMKIPGIKEGLFQKVSKYITVK